MGGEREKADRAESLERIGTAVDALKRLTTKENWEALTGVAASQPPESDALAALVRLDKEERRVLQAAIDLGEWIEKNRVDGLKLRPNETKLWEWLDSLGAAADEAGLDENPADDPG